jgi:hypothetical protein
MYSRLLKHLSDNSILSNHQLGFRVNQGTENAIFKLISGILNLLNQKMLVGGMFCDLEKAFDCVSHETLLKEAKSMPILFTDDASVLISHSNPIKFKNTINEEYGLRRLV